MSALELLEQAEEVRAELVAHGVKKPKEKEIAEQLKGRLIWLYKKGWEEHQERLAKRSMSEMSFDELVNFLVSTRETIARECGPDTEKARRYVNFARKTLRENQARSRHPISIDFPADAKVVFNGEEMSGEDARRAFTAWLEAIGAEIHRK